MMYQRIEFLSCLTPYQRMMRRGFVLVTQRRRSITEAQARALAQLQAQQQQFFMVPRRNAQMFAIMPSPEVEEGATCGKKGRSHRMPHHARQPAFDDETEQADKDLDWGDQ